MAERRKVFIGAAWPYANGDLHLGHIAGCLLPADIFARFNRLMGNDVLFVSGSDMHGTPITVTADREGTTPETVAMRSHRSIERTIADLDITYDIYTNTHTDHHFEVVQEIFIDLLEKDLIEKRVQEAPFCPSCHRFMPDRYIEGECPKCAFPEARGDQCDRCGAVHDARDLIGPRCKLCGTAPEFRDTEHYYLLLSKLEPRIREVVDDSKDRWRPNTRNNTENFLREGLKDRAITRDLTWGVPIPLAGHEGKCIYVWFEAVCGYLSASKLHFLNKGDPEGYEGFWKDPSCKHYYFLAKDNIPFHTIIWPSILAGIGGLNLPYDIPSNEYLQWDGSQFSKSRGHGVTVNGFLKDYPVDPLRFYLSLNMPERSDSNFDLNEFVQKNNTELLGAIGNYLHRVTSFIHANYGATTGIGELDDRDKAILDIARNQYDEALALMGEVRLKEGIRAMMVLVNEANRYFNDRAPWKMVKEDRSRCATVLAASLSVARTIVFGRYAYIPHSMTRWCEMVGIRPPSDSNWRDGLAPVPEGMELQKPEPLFMKLEITKESTDKEDATMERKEDPSGLIAYNEFKRMDLRIGLVMEVTPHPNADKLFVLKVDLGEDGPRQILAGLRGHYTAEQLLGKRIVVVSNLEPARMRGLESSGMLLAAESGGVVSLLTIDREVPPGSRIH